MTCFSASLVFLTILPASPLNISFWRTTGFSSYFLFMPDPVFTAAFLDPTFPSSSANLASKTPILLSFYMMIVFSLCFVLSSSFSFVSITLISSFFVFSSSSFLRAATYSVLRCSSSRRTSFTALVNLV